MAEVKIRHYALKRNGRGFWQASVTLRKLGFPATVPCGKDGPAAWALAEQWNERADRARKGAVPCPRELRKLSPAEAEARTVYPEGSLGEAFKRYRNTDEWGKKKKPRTREDWWRAWKRIKPVFGDLPPNAVTLEDISIFRSGVERAVSLREAHRAIKIWRALWQVAAALKYCKKDEDPSFGVVNSAAKGPGLTWIEGEAARLFKGAWRAGYKGLAALIAVAWDTQMSPGDTRQLCASQMAKGRAGEAFFAERAKTGKPIGGLLTGRAIAALTGYLGGLGVELHDDAPIFRNRSGAPYSKDTLGDDFRDVRAAVFGQRERRTLAQFRHSGAVEAITGDATPAALSHAMGNTLSASNVLFETYVPVNVATLTSVQKARRIGRTKLRS